MSNNNLTPLSSLYSNPETKKRCIKQPIPFIPNIMEEDNQFRSGSVAINTDCVDRSMSHPSVVPSLGGERSGLCGHLLLSNTFKFGGNFTINNNIPKYEDEYVSDKMNEYLSKEMTQHLQLKCVKILQELTKNETLDYTIMKDNKYIIKCRLFSKDSIEFDIKLYQLTKLNKNGYKSLLQFKRITNPDFGYYEFKQLFLEKCKLSNIITQDEEKNDDNNQLISISNSLSDLSLTFDDIDEIDVNDSMNDTDYENENTDDILSDKEYDYQLCKSMISTLSDSKSYREEYISDAYQLSTYLLNNNKNIIEYILKNETDNIISKILEPIINSKINDAFIILHVLKSIKYLLELNNDNETKLNIPNNLIQNIQYLEKLWSNENGVVNTFGPITITFIKSQQIQIACQAILDLIIQ